MVTGTCAGDDVVAGAVTGRRDGRDLALAWSHLLRTGSTEVGRGDCRLDGDRITGALELVETDPTPWLRVRVAHPTRDLDAAVAFYGGLLGLPVDGPHLATPYDLVFFALPGGGQLELTAGGPAPLPSTGDDLLVLYVPTPAHVDALRERLGPGVPADNPYWAATGLTLVDPDGRRVVLAHLPA